MKLAIDLENTLEKKEVFDFANRLLDEGNEIVILTTRSGHIKSDSNYDIEQLARRLRVSFTDIIFVTDKKSFFEFSDDICGYLSDNLIDLQLCDDVVKTIPIFGNKNWKNDCLEILNVMV